MNNDRIYYSRDAEVHAMRGRTVLTLFLLAFGLTIGSVVALLFAPRSGKKTRDNLVKTVEKGLKDGREAVQPVMKQVEKEFDELKKNVEERLKS